MTVAELIERLQAVSDHDLEIECPSGGRITGIDLYEGSTDEPPFYRIASHSKSEETDWTVPAYWHDA